MIFTVPGRPEGYRALGRFPNWGVMKKYHAFCEKVRLYAKEAGLTLPLVATAEKPLWIGVLAYSEDGNITDPANVSKGIVDALFYTKAKSGTKGDAFVAAWNMPPCWDIGNPRTMVWIGRDAHDSTVGYAEAIGLWRISSHAQPVRIKVRRASRVAPTEQRKPATSAKIRFKCGHTRGVTATELVKSGKSLAEYIWDAGQIDCERCIFVSLRA